MARNIRVDTEAGTRVAGAYAHALRETCIRECEDASNPFTWLGADEEQRAEIDAEVEKAGIRLAKRRARKGKPIKALWYQLPPGLPAPLDTVGKVGGPRIVEVTADDVITPVVADGLPGL